jgi:putative AlgH/UPF0301 family transcriptional regulator
VLEHHHDGALGVVLNRPTDEPLDEPLDRWADLQADPQIVFEGGPVEPDALIALALARKPSPSRPRSSPPCPVGSCRPTSPPIRPSSPVR